MPKIAASDSKSSHDELPRRYHAFPCRICKRPHPLRTCRTFLSMNINDRIHAVRKHKYCSNCLAHDHSHGICFSKRGCKHCHKFHHTLLHVNPRLIKDLLTRRSSSRSPSPQPSTSRKSNSSSRSKASLPSTSKSNSSSRSKASLPSTSKATSLTSILRQNTIVLLPTVLVKVSSNHTRCLLDSGSTVSRVSKRFVDKLNLTAFSLREETFCPIVLKSRFDPSSKIEGTFRVDNRITLRTPSESLPEHYKTHFRDMFLADSKFYESSSIDIVIGADLYPKIILEGVFSKPGLPSAQSTIFGWTIYGPCSL
ncbi:uncharacterized protein LOC135962172 [Calliphora vicina]|uniref:uncharacterized protein LOC135962172 n=1 Tax=Calliphora vicina TaxID=7373 RepID=UPI00325B29FB